MILNSQERNLILKIRAAEAQAKIRNKARRERRWADSLAGSSRLRFLIREFQDTIDEMVRD